jgi:hypothetical protein
MCGMSAVPSPGLLAAVRSRSGGPVGRGGESQAAHNRHPVVSRRPVWIAVGCHPSIRRQGIVPPLLAGEWRNAQHFLPSNGACAPLPVPRSGGGGGAAIRIQPGIPEYVSRVRGAPAARSQRTTPVHGCGMRAASGQETPGMVVAAVPFTATMTADRVSLQRPAVGMCAQANSPLTPAGPTE